MDDEQFRALFVDASDEPPRPEFSSDLIVAKGRQAVRRTRVTRATLGVAAIAILATGAAALQGVSPFNHDRPPVAADPSNGVKVVKEGKLTVCTAGPFRPFVFRKDDRIVGFDLDLMDRVAEVNDLTVELDVTPFEAIQTGHALDTGLCDVAAAGMTITDQRATVVDFSDPYFDANQALLTNDPNIDSLEKLAGKKIGVQPRSTGQAYVEHDAPDAELVMFDDVGRALAAVKTGQVDAYLADNGPLLDYAKRNPDTFVTAEFDIGERYGFAVKKNGNDALLGSINALIADAKSSGNYDTLYKKWFGSPP